jgi:ribokinase
MAKAPIVVIGSINMDLICRVSARPGPGETVAGSDLATIPGGKGANQAVAAAKLGERVHLIGRVGDDDFGQRLLNGLSQHNVNTGRVIVTEGTSSGCAVILVDKTGENSIVVSPGANAHLTPDDIDASRDIIESAAVVLLQLEIPLKTVEPAISVCRQAAVMTILDPAPVPAKGLSRALYGVDYFVPNQNEAEALLHHGSMGRSKRTKRPDARQIGQQLLERGPATVILKLGAKGCMIVNEEDGEPRIEHVKGYRAEVVDTTAAGDAFTAALATGLAEGMDLGRAARFANAAGAKCCEKFGAQPSLPTRIEVEAMMGGMH